MKIRIKKTQREFAVLRNLIAVIAAAALASCYSPQYPAQYKCSTAAPLCPEGYTCINKKCVEKGSKLDSAADALKEAGPDLSLDAPGMDALKQDTTKSDAAKDAGADLGLDAPKADAQKPDGPSPDAVKPDAPLPDAQLPDTALPDLQLPDLQQPDTLFAPDKAPPDIAPTPDGPITTPDQGSVIPGLVGSYKLDEGSGSIPKDSSGQNNHGAITGARWGSAIRFSGTSSYVWLGSNSGTTSMIQLALSAWIHLESTADGMIVANFKNSNGFMFRVEKSKLNLTIGPGGATEYSLSGKTTLKIGVWYHVAATYDGTVMRVFVNGVIDGSKVQPDSLAALGLSLVMGSDSLLAGGWWFKGSIDELKICNRAKTPAQVLSEYQRGGINTDLVMHFPMSEATGNYTYNATYHGGTSQLKGGASWTPGRGPFGGALVFDGTNDYVDLNSGTSLGNLSQVTVSAWIRLNSLGTQSVMTLSAPQTGYMLRVYNNKLCLAIDTSVTNEVCSLATLKTDRWYHVTGTYDGSNMLVYIDGNASGTMALKNGLTPTTSFKAAMGSNGDKNAYWFHGEIGSLRVYNYGLNGLAVQSLAQRDNTCPAAFTEDFDDNNITDWTPHSLAFLHDDKGKRPLPAAAAGTYHFTTTKTPYGGHHRALLAPIHSFTFEIRARMRSDPANAGMASVGIFRDDAMVKNGNGVIGYGYYCLWYASNGRVAVQKANGSSPDGAQEVAVGYTTTKNNDWHDITCSRKVDGSWELTFDGQKLTLSKNIKDRNFTFFSQVSTMLDANSVIHALDDIEIRDCSQDPDADQVKFSDTFTDDAGWTTAATGKIFRDATNENLVWSVIRNDTRVMSRLLPREVNDFTMQFDIRYDSTNANCWIDVGAATSPTPATTITLGTLSKLKYLVLGHGAVTPGTTDACSGLIDNVSFKAPP